MGIQIVEVDMPGYLFTLQVIRKKPLVLQARDHWSSVETVQLIIQLPRANWNCKSIFPADAVETIDRAKALWHSFWVLFHCLHQINLISALYEQQYDAGDY